MSTSSFARHTIYKTGDTGSFRADYQIPFSPLQYSRFKYGSKSTAREFGEELANGFLQSDQFRDLLPQLQQKAGVIYPSPYNFIPTATNAMKDYFLHRFNSVAVNEYGIKPLREGKIYRNHSYNEDYGAMTKAERDQAISGDEFRIETGHLDGEVLLFMDDIRITGSHEERMAHMVEKYNLTNPHLYLYYARVDKPEFIDPKLENFLNYAAVNDLLSINQIIQNDKFIFNTRVVKYILGAGYDEFTYFIQYQSAVFQSTLLNYATGNSYFTEPAFTLNYQYLYQLTHRQKAVLV